MIAETPEADLPTGNGDQLPIDIVHGDANDRVGVGCSDDVYEIRNELFFNHIVLEFGRRKVR